MEDIDSIFAAHQAECEAVVSRIFVEDFRMTQENRSDTPAYTNLSKLIHDLTSCYGEMKAEWSQLIQCVIRCDYTMVFSNISENVWATYETVDKATEKARETIDARNSGGRGKAHA